MLPERSWRPHLSPQKSYWHRGTATQSWGYSRSWCQQHLGFSRSTWLSVYHQPTYNSHFGPKISALVFSAAGWHFLRLWSSDGRTSCSWTESQRNKGALILNGTFQLLHKWMLSDCASWGKWCFEVWHVIWKKYFSKSLLEIEMFVLILKKKWGKLNNTVEGGLIEVTNTNIFLIFLSWIRSIQFIK